MLFARLPRPSSTTADGERYPGMETFGQPPGETGKEEADLMLQLLRGKADMGKCRLGLTRFQ
jgi:hypothetical protein